MSKARKNGLMNKEIDQSIFAERDIFYKIKDKEKWMREREMKKFLLVCGDLFQNFKHILTYSTKYRRNQRVLFFTEEIMKIFFFFCSLYIHI